MDWRRRRRRRRRRRSRKIQGQWRREWRGAN
jgi:hypothetical protein